MLCDATLAANSPQCEIISDCMYDGSQSLQPPEVTTAGDDVPLLMEEDSQDINNLRDTYHELRTQLHSLIAEV